MRVGLIIYGSIDTISGGYMYDRMLVTALRDAGHTVEIVSIPWRGYARHLVDNLSRDVFRRLIEPEFDLLLQDELNHPSLVLLNHVVRRWSECPIVAIVHHLRCRERWSWWQCGIFQEVERAYLRSVDAVIVNSPTTRRDVESLFGRGRPTCVAVPSGSRLKSLVDVTEIRRRANQPGPLRLAFLGNVIPRKSLDTLLTALALLRSSSWTLHVIGSLQVDRNYARAIGAQIAELGLSHAVTLHGHTTDDDVARMLAHSHVLAVPSYFEGFGIAYVEAMRFGLPVIATNVGAASDTVFDGITGLLVPPNDPVALASAVNRLVDDRAFLAQLGSNAFEAAQSHPTWAETTSSMVAFLEHFVAGWRLERHKRSATEIPS